eukprot:CAMPEP_0118865990 /NCGR_PEP_ID=MMETSP1163-20130328/10067_1 /TAXON_ID=124430 /ORGANISM="Phaeomonas parva, Strain CCMP2877" /LENGTH=199 /DNA_ID=CAMNT_0006800269 /DNA_START=34 /DNA_END=634 /DNA_ORIENTATION=-
MFVLKKDRIAVYTYLFNEGVIVAQKDFYKAKHSDELDVHNNVVIQLMKGLHSMGPPPDPTEKNPEIRRYVKQTYAWQHYYWYLTEDGLEYLRNYLHIPKDVVPKTRQTRQASRPARPERGDDRYGDRGDRGDRGFGREKRVEGGLAARSSPATASAAASAAAASAAAGMASGVRAVPAVVLAAPTERLGPAETRAVLLG